MRDEAAASEPEPEPPKTPVQRKRKATAPPEDSDTEEEESGSPSRTQRRSPPARPPPPPLSIPSPLPVSHSVGQQPMVVATKKFSHLTGPLIGNISSHRFANLFAAPIPEKNAPGYKNLVYKPQDIKSETLSLRVVG
jgi:hypothetical protein